jgi:hypothetical protein
MKRILPFLAIPLLAGALYAQDGAMPTTPPPAGNAPVHGDGPGRGDPAKMAERLNQLKDRNPELFKRLDANGDGTISADEAEAHRKKEGARIQEALDQIFIQADKDGDGKLDRKEFGEAAAMARRQMEQAGRGPGGPGGPDRGDRPHKKDKGDKGDAPAGAR